MPTCDECGDDVSMPYDCRRCSGRYCSDHRLPEYHECTGLSKGGPDPQRVVDNAKQMKESDSRAKKTVSRVKSSLRGFRGNVSYLFLAVIVVVYLLELVVLRFGSSELFQTLFVLSSSHPEYVWTWITSVFSHSPGGFGHIIGNGILLFFFGPTLEKQIGSKRFAGLFLVAGVVAGLAQVGSGFLLGNPVSGVLGASGALMAVMGAITILNPKLTVYLYLVIPTPVWVLTLGYAALSVFGVFGTGLMSNVAHIAHLSGLVIGLIYADYMDTDIESVQRLNLGGGSRGGGRPPRKRF